MDDDEIIDDDEVTDESIWAYITWSREASSEAIVEAHAALEKGDEALLAYLTGASVEDIRRVGGV